MIFKALAPMFGMIFGWDPNEVMAYCAIIGVPIAVMGVFVALLALRTSAGGPGKSGGESRPGSKEPLFIATALIIGSMLIQFMSLYIGYWGKAGKAATASDVAFTGFMVTASVTIVVMVLNGLDKYYG